VIDGEAARFGADGDEQDGHDVGAAQGRQAGAHRQLRRARHRREQRCDSAGRDHGEAGDEDERAAPADRVGDEQAGVHAEDGGERSAAEHDGELPGDRHRGVEGSRLRASRLARGVASRPPAEERWRCTS
jgi:hypothetical protein